MKFFKSCKNIICKICGKARWLILALVLLLILNFLIDLDMNWQPYLYGVSDSDGLPLREHQIEEIWCFSVNDGGQIGILSRETRRHSGRWEIFRRIL